jgi:hypothetical protein
VTVKKRFPQDAGRSFAFALIDAYRITWEEVEAHLRARKMAARAARLRKAVGEPREGR